MHCDSTHFTEFTGTRTADLNTTTGIREPYHAPARPWHALRFALLAGTIALLAACGGQEKESATSSVETDSVHPGAVLEFTGRTVLDSLRVDLTGDGVAELVVASRADSLDDDMLMVDRFDRVDILSTAPTGAERLFFDVVDYGASLRTADVTGDSIADVIVHLDAGGNNPIASQGMHLYGRSAKGAVTLLFFVSSGAPQLRDLDGDGVQEILVSDQFWGMMAHSEVIGFTRMIYAFDGNSYAPANARFARYFDRIVAAKRRAYEQMKAKAVVGDDDRMRLYIHTADYLVWSYASGGVRRAGAVWRAEREYLRGTLHDEQYQDLSSFIDDIDEIENAAASRQVS